MEREQVRKGYHFAWQIHYYIVFPVKYRKALLDAEVVEIMLQKQIAIKERFEIEIEIEICTDKNHIHLLCEGTQSYFPDV